MNFSLCIGLLAIFWAIKIHALTFFDRFGLPDPVPLPYLGTPNSTQFANPQVDTRDILSPRQSCNYPNGWCSNSGKCCASNAICCPGGCGDPAAGSCCSTGQCNADKPYCCHDKGCLGPQDECCQGSGWCPSPFICVLIVRSGARGCCTDLSCMVYLDMEGDTTVTRTVSTAEATATAERATTVAQVSSTITTAPQVTSAYTSVIVATDQYQAYDTTIYWTYWYYFYTRVVLVASTVTSRTITTVTETTTFTCQATASTAAQASFLSMSRDLPTPSDAESSIPIRPTVGAIVVGSCISTKVIGSATSICETEIAAVSSSSSSSAGSASSSGSTTYGGTATSIAPVRSLSVVTLCGVGMISAWLML